MDIIKRKPREGGTLNRFQDEMNDLFGRFFGGESFWPIERGTWWPAVDIAEKADSITIKADLPGMKSEDIEISVQDNMLTISGEKKESKEEKDEHYYHSERRYGSFRRDIALAPGVDADKIKADYKDGVLTVTLPKTEQAKPKRIEIKKE